MRTKLKLCETAPTDFKSSFPSCKFSFKSNMKLFHIKSVSELHQPSASDPATDFTNDHSMYEKKNILSKDKVYTCSKKQSATSLPL